MMGDVVNDFVIVGGVVDMNCVLYVEMVYDSGDVVCVMIYVMIVLYLVGVFVIVVVMCDDLVFV